MSFEARNLRIQLPYGDVTIRDCGLAHTIIGCGAYGHTIGVFGCQFPHTLPPPECWWHSMLPCAMGSGACGYSPVMQGDPGTIVVQPEHLGILRERLEAQLKEIDQAEEKLREFGEQKEG